VIDWGSFVLVAVVSLVAACLLVAFASVGFRLYDHGKRERAGAERGGGRWATAGAVLSFAVCAAAVLFGVYLIVPAFA
jgi:hypothetical protein